MTSRKATFGIATILAIVVVLVVAVSLISITSEDVEAGKKSRRAKACNDGMDNDGDGLIDYPADPGCKDKKDKKETNKEIECDDGDDNDGDSLVDMQDPGCTDPLDDDEYNAAPYCGDGECNGNETSYTCPEDCGQPDSCTDTDGGFDIFTQGTVSGYNNNVPFSNTDFCLNLTVINEYYCSGTTPAFFIDDCGLYTNGTGTCVDGACVF